MQTINDIVAQSHVEASVTIDYTPKGPPFTYVTGVTTVTPSDAYFGIVRSTMTFVASITFYDQSDRTWASEYRWDMGDGTILYGQTVTHIYYAPNKNTIAQLRVTDNHSQRHTAARVMYLEDFPITYALRAINVAST